MGSNMIKSRTKNVLPGIIRSAFSIDILMKFTIKHWFSHGHTMNYQRNMAWKTQQTLELNQVYQVNPRHLETECKLRRKFSASSKQKHQLLLGCAGSSTAILVAKATRTSSPGLSPWLMSPGGPEISSNPSGPGSLCRSLVGSPGDVPNGMS